MMIKPIKVPPNFKGGSFVYKEDGSTRHLGEIVDIARKKGVKETPAPVEPCDYDSYIPYGTPSSATRHEIADFNRRMASLKCPENFDIEA
jgi:hypothetical protein